ncbi:MAG TPA: hypothetical protein VHF06_05450 [Pseudonocardiaceae bacterium]|jgi:hypothetical protein|nr:hypothetical protein [Pseudonocardiaceae bacterium]
MHPSVTETAQQDVVRTQDQGSDLAWPDALGRTRRSAALVLSLAVLIGAAGVGAAFGAGWTGVLVALAVAVPAGGLVAAVAWWATLWQPQSGHGRGAVLAMRRER